MPPRGPRSLVLADRFRAAMGLILWRYRDAEGTPLEVHLKRLRMPMPYLFVLVGHPGVESTNKRLSGPSGMSRCTAR